MLIIQCDERKPCCARCSRTNTICSFEPHNLPHIIEQKRDSTERLLYHIHQYPIEGIGSEPVASLCKSHPYLFSAILALSASHLQHLQPSQSNMVAAHFHQSATLRSFSSAITTELEVQPLTQQSSDALLITSMLLNVLLFNSSDPWVFSDDPNRLGWFNLFLGMTPLLMATKEFHQDSLLRYIFDASNIDAELEERACTLEKSPAWSELCDGETMFDEPLEVLAMLKGLEANRSTLWLYASFFGRLDANFRDLLDNGDLRAMWIVGYWMGLLCRFDEMWWLHNMAKRDHKDIQIWLRNRVRGDMWAELMNDLRDAPNQP